METQSVSLLSGNGDSVTQDKRPAPFPLFRNRDAIAGKLPNSFTSHYHAGYDGQGRHVVELSDDRAGIVMAPTKDYDAWMKSDFQKIAKPDAPAELLAKGRRDFGVASDEDLRNIRTVGCGTNVFVALADGLFYAAVQRTPPKKTDSGTVNPGAYSRPAGGSTGNIDLSALRELNEEMFMVVRMNGRHTALHIMPESYNVDPRQERACLEERRDRFPGILEAYGQKDIRLTNHFEIKTPCLAVPGLTEDVVERTVFSEKILKNRVFGDSPAQMDINGIDAITVVHLPNISSRDVCGIWDGELNQNDELLRRRWALYPVDDIHGQFARKEIAMSPVPGRVVLAKDDVVKAIHMELEV